MVKPPYDFIADGLKAGEVVPFFGAAASAIYRPRGERWEPGKPFTPFGAELANTLAEAASYPALDEAYSAALSDLLPVLQGIISGPLDRAEAAIAPLLRKHLTSPPPLALVASWAEHVQGHRRAIDRKLHECFAAECEPGLLQTKLAETEGIRFYVTTNYDHLLERSLAARQPHSIVDRGDKGLWVSVAGGPPQQMASTGNELYARLNDPKTHLPSHPIVFKMHGSVDLSNAADDAYLVTEEDYVDFLGRSGGSYLPPYVNGLMEGKDFLFLGYSLEDWNVRVILRKLLKRTPTVPVRFWAIVRGRSDIQQRIWHAHNLNIYAMDLQEFAEELANHL
jgi:hypothetical protein